MPRKAKVKDNPDLVKDTKSIFSESIPKDSSDVWTKGLKIVTKKTAEIKYTCMRDTLP